MASLKLYEPVPVFWYLKVLVPLLVTIWICHIILKFELFGKRVNIRFQPCLD